NGQAVYRTGVGSGCGILIGDGAFRKGGHVRLAFAESSRISGGDEKFHCRTGTSVTVENKVTALNARSRDHWEIQQSIAARVSVAVVVNGHERTGSGALIITRRKQIDTNLVSRTATDFVGDAAVGEDRILCDHVA